MRHLWIAILSLFLFFGAHIDTISAQYGGTCGQEYTLAQNICPAACQADYFGGSSDPNRYCCGFVENKGTANAICRPIVGAGDAEVISCGNGYTNERPNAVCDPACPANGSYLDESDNTIKTCCGTITNDSCYATPPTSYASCGAIIAKTSNTSCTCRSGVADFGTQNFCCGWVDSRGICLQNEPSSAPVPAVCGESYPASRQATTTCNCPNGANTLPSGRICCGWNDPLNLDGGNDNCARQDPSTISRPTKACGQAFNPLRETCTCANNMPYDPPQPNSFCCGWADGSLSGCSATAPPTQPPTVAPTVLPSAPPRDTPTAPPIGESGASAYTFDQLNQAIFNGPPATDLTTPRGIISRALPYLFTFSGLILFTMIIWGGFEMLGGASNPQSQEAGKHRITNAVVGFLLLFCSYFLAQLVELILRVDIL